MFHVHYILGYGSHGKVFLITSAAPSFEKRLPGPRLHHIFSNSKEFRKLYHTVYDENEIYKNLSRNYRNLQSNRNLYALKVSCCTDEDTVENQKWARQLLENEISVLSSLDHKGIIKYRGCINYRLWVGMIVDFHPASDLFTRYKSLKLPNLVQIFKRLVSALEYLHKHRIIHADIKTENVLLADNGWPVLSDFGLAMRIPDGSHSVYRDRIYGTLACQPPEVVVKQRYSEKSDVWAFGILVYECIYGQNPYNGDDTGDYIEMITSRKIYYPSFKDPRAIDFLKFILQYSYNDRPSFRSLAKHSFINF